MKSSTLSSIPSIPELNDPLASTKLIHQGDKQRIYWLTAYDQASPYLIAGENGSTSGKGGQAFSNIFSY